MSRKINFRMMDVGWLLLFPNLGHFGGEEGLLAVMRGVMMNFKTRN